MRPSPPLSSTAVDALLFDLGGVVIEIDFGRVFQAWADAAGVSHSQLAERFSLDAGYEAHERGEIGAQEYCAHLRATLGVALADDILLSGWNQIFTGAIPGVEGLLESLARSFPLYAFSNTNVAHRAFWQVRYANLLQPFSQIFCSCDLGTRKPSADAFLEVSRRIGIAPGRIVFFDDHPQNVLGAREAGLLAHEVHSAGDIRAALQHEGIRCDC
jgi:putative hydrolase of the HAD superfamily